MTLSPKPQTGNPQANKSCSVSERPPKPPQSSVWLLEVWVSDFALRDLLGIQEGGVQSLTRLIKLWLEVFASQFGK